MTRTFPVVSGTSITNQMSSLTWLKTPRSPQSARHGSGEPTHATPNPFLSLPRIPSAQRTQGIQFLLLRHPNTVLLPPYVRSSGASSPITSMENANSTTNSTKRSLPEAPRSEMNPFHLHRQPEEQRHHSDENPIIPITSAANLILPPSSDNTDLNSTSKPTRTDRHSSLIRV